MEKKNGWLGTALTLGAVAAAAAVAYTRREEIRSFLSGQLGTEKKPADGVEEIEDLPAGDEGTLVIDISDEAQKKEEETGAE